MRPGARFQLDPAWVSPEPAPVPAAVSLALAVFKQVKVTRLAELDGQLPATVWLSEGQVALLNSNLAVINLIRSSGIDRDTKARVPVVTIAWCPVCHRWQLQGSGQAPRVCALTMACPGRPIKVEPAIRINEG